MDGIRIVKDYLDRIVNCDDKGGRGGGGMKILLLDSATTKIVSCVYSQTEINAKQVYLVSRLDSQTNPALTNGAGPGMGKSSHLKAVVFVRPTETNVGLLVRELGRPRFSEYHVFFSGILSPGHLRLLAENDPKELVRQLQELYADFLPINEDLWTLQCRHSIPMTCTAGTTWAQDHVHIYDRNIQGLQSMLLALKKQPSMIRYSNSSASTQQLAADLADSIRTNQIFHCKRNDPGLLVLVLDRKDDPITPLLSQWTYQAMVHEIMGLNSNRVILKGAPNVSKDLDEVVLSPNQDPFFKENRHKNFGELGLAIQTMLKEYERQTQQNSTANLSSLEDIQDFITTFPELKSKSHNVSKHVAIVGELARIIEICGLMEISQFEQTLACNDEHSSHLQELLEKIRSERVKIPDKLRLALLYSLRYEKFGKINQVMIAMHDGGVPPDMIDLIKVLLRYAGKDARGPGLFGDSSIVSKMTKNFMSSVQGVENVYSQHVPLLMDTIQDVMKGRLRQQDYPFVVRPKHPQPETIVPDSILVFMVGGVTYEEATKVSEFNCHNEGGVQIVLAGSTVHNSTSFLEELKTQ